MYPLKEGEPATIFIDGNGRFRLGDVRNESLELLYRLGRTSAAALSRTLEYGHGSMKIGAAPSSPGTLRLAINPEVSTYPARRAWQRRQSRVQGFLNQMQIDTTPSDQPDRIFRDLSIEDLSYRYKDVIAFWDSMNNRVTAALEQGIRGYVDTIGLAQSAYADSITMRVALVTGVYKLGTNKP